MVVVEDGATARFDVAVGVVVVGTDCGMVVMGNGKGGSDVTSSKIVVDPITYGREVIIVVVLSEVAVTVVDACTAVIGAGEVVVVLVVGTTVVVVLAESKTGSRVAADEPAVICSSVEPYAPRSTVEPSIIGPSVEPDVIGSSIVDELMVTRVPSKPDGLAEDVQGLAIGLVGVDVGVIANN